MADPRDSAPGAEPLMAALSAGTPGAAERLLHAYAPVVRGAIARYVALHGGGASDLVEDLTQEALLALLLDNARRLRAFEGRNGCSFAGWLRVVAVRCAIDVLRREGRVTSLDADTPGMTALRRELRAHDGDPEEAVAGAETAVRLRAAVSALPPKDRVLVELHLLRGAPLPGVAAALGVSTNAAYIRKSRVLDRLRRTMGREG